MSLSPPNLVASRRQWRFYGWWIVIATALLIAYLAGALFWSFSFFVGPIQAEMKWSVEALGAAYLIQGTTNALLAPAAGALFDRFGPRRVAVAGVLMSGLGLILMGRAESLWQFDLAFTIAGIGFLATTQCGFSAVANWFVRRRGLAMGVASLGVAFAGSLAPVIATLVDRLGWRATYAVLGLGAWFILTPLVLVLRRRPEDHGLLPDGDEWGPGTTLRAAGMVSLQGKVVEGTTVQQAVRSASFWLLVYSFLMSFWAIGAIQVHIVPYLKEAGIPSQRAASVVAILSLATILGRIAIGWLSGRADLRWLAAGFMAIQALGTVLFGMVSTSGTWLLIVFLLTFSPALGALMVIQPVLQGHYFGRRAFGTISGVMFMVTSLAWSGGPYLLGLLKDLFGGYQPGLFVLAALNIAGVAGLLALRSPEQGSSSPDTR